ncbi:type II toxin-antitoxin system HicB family antitoxin [Salinicola salarius]|uniref:type II toxin-antitoxin system HicB family antitoxin n=1 Tax=Salinicola salarius TaxID=430457 RepID=UPI0023F8745F|nr:type II toxin-antitoxin system HicB family antitoxin [Salinicola salarius]
MKNRYAAIRPHTALCHDQFELYYHQAIVEAVSGRIRGLEALIRWRHPQKGMISPGKFNPLAEKTGQIIPPRALGATRGLPGRCGQTDTAYGVTFPDFPGCYSAADEMADLPRMAQEAVEVHFEGEDMAIPAPSTPEDWEGHEDFQGGYWMLI